MNRIESNDPSVVGLAGSDPVAGARQQRQETAEDFGLSSDEQEYGLVDVAAALGLDSSDDLV